MKSDYEVICDVCAKTVKMSSAEEVERVKGKNRDGEPVAVTVYVCDVCSGGDAP